MSSDIYASLSGASAAWAQLEVVANNVSNASTHGFKAGQVAFVVDGPEGEPNGQVYAQPTEVVPDMSDGTIEHDGDPLHLALQGDGFFTVDTGQGVMLTRSGRFELNPDGELVTARGHKVLGNAGPIALPPGEMPQITADGRVVLESMGEIDQIRLVTGPASPVDNGLWSADGPLREADAHVTQGALEGSNVDAMAEMVDLIQASRAFEAFQKAMQASDSLDERINRLRS